MIEFKSEAFNLLTTIGPKFILPYGNQGKKEYWQKCICVCGVIKNIRCRHLKTTNSCGCVHKKDSSEKWLKHGYGGTPEYESWFKMKDRCLNTDYHAYKDYGGRGITICERWLDEENGISNFVEDMGKRPSSKYTLDRIDNNGNYEPKNCRWATKKEQSRNRRSNVLFRYNNEEKCAAEWCEQLKMPKSTFFNRLKRGWSIERTLMEPVREKKNKK